MSKEQTPIEVFCKELMEEIQEGTSLSNIIDKVSKRENAKVLEGIESELRKALKHHLQPTLLEHYIATEIKPKYKL